MFLKQLIAVLMTCTLPSTTSVANTLPEGSSDRDQVVAKMASRLEEAMSELAALKSRLDLVQCSAHVGFTLTLDVNLTVPPEEIIKFDYIMYNEGQGYDPQTGYFTAPVGGMYLFFVQAETPPGAGFGLSLIKEGSEWAYISGNNKESRLTLFDEVILNLHQGQRVWILKRDNSNPVIRHRSNFGGFLIAPDRQCVIPKKLS